MIELTIPLGANPALVTDNPYTLEDSPDGYPAAAHNENLGLKFGTRPGGAEARPTVVPVGYSPSKGNGYGEYARPVIQHDGTTEEHGKEKPGGNYAPIAGLSSATMVHEKPMTSQHGQAPNDDHGEPAGPGYEPQETKEIGPGKDEAITKPSSVPSAEVTKAVPKPEPAGPLDAPKPSTVPMANMPSTPPDSPVIVAAGHVARGIDSVLTFLALVVGLFLIL